MHSLGRAIVCAAVLAGFAVAQQPPVKDDSAAANQSAGAAAAAPAKNPVLSQLARLQAAKTVYIKKGIGGNDIPFNVISNGFDGWAKYLVVNSPEQADLIVEVNAPEEVDASSVTVTSSSSSGTINGKEDVPRHADQGRSDGCSKQDSAVAEQRATKGRYQEDFKGRQSGRGVAEDIPAVP